MNVEMLELKLETARLAMEKFPDQAAFWAQRITNLLAELSAMGVEL